MSPNISRHVIYNLHIYIVYIIINISTDTSTVQLVPGGSPKDFAQKYRELLEEYAAKASCRSAWGINIDLY